MSIYDSLAVIQQTLKVSKSRVNAFGNYSYRSVDDILNEVRPLLNTFDKSDCILTLNDDLVSIGEFNYVKSTASLVLVEDGSSIISNGYAKEAAIQKGMQASQITGSASTYARKSALAGLFLLSDHEPDSDQVNKHDVEVSTSNKPFEI